jgi:hypothetical protein
MKQKGDYVMRYWGCWRRLLGRLLAVGVIACAAQSVVHAGGSVALLSPSGKYRLVRTREAANSDVAIVLATNRVQVGVIKGPEEGRWSVGPVSWSPDEHRFSIVIHRGTKVTDVLFYERTRAGGFREVPVCLPTIAAAPGKSRGEGDGMAGVYTVGAWTTPVRTSVLMGSECVERGEVLIHLTVVEVSFEGKRPRTWITERKGPLGSDAFDAFIQHWGEQYFE